MVLKLSYPVCLQNEFENDVEMYGAQTNTTTLDYNPMFENDVEMYGAQTARSLSLTCTWFENDVEMYGAQTDAVFSWYAK